MKLWNYKNGNANVTLESDGSRTIEYEGNLNLDYPLNIDIRVSTKCSFADNICKDFCHESALINGKECDYDLLKSKLNNLPKGIELAIGCNELTTGLLEFLHWCYNKDYICNLTVNQGHLRRDCHKLLLAIENDWIKGLGVSYRSSLKWNIPLEILQYDHTVFHCIIGIDSIQEILDLKNKGVNKILCLGEKDFGFNSGKVNLNTKLHKQWKWWISKLFNIFDVVSFDNLALQQLKLKRFFNEKDWNTFNQDEHSFYIDAVSQTYAPSSRSDKKESWNKSIKKYYEIKQA